MNLRFLLLALVGMMGTLGGGAAGTVSAQVDLYGDPYRYAHCVLHSDPGLAHRCGVAVEASETEANAEVEWPAHLASPRVGPVSIEGDVFICSGRPDVLVMGTVDSDGDSQFYQLNSPTACGGEESGRRGITLRAEIDPYYPPMLRPTMIAFLFADRTEMHMGVCTATPGNLAIFWRTAGTEEIDVITFYSPIWCSRGA